MVPAHGDSLWVVKATQGDLYDEMQNRFEPVVTRPGWSAPPLDVRQAQTVEKGHGRLEKRRIRVSSELSDYRTWPHVAHVFKLESQRTDALGRTQEEVRYGISSLPACLADPKRPCSGAEATVAWETACSIDAMPPWARTMRSCEWGRLPACWRCATTRPLDCWLAVEPVISPTPDGN